MGASHRGTKPDLVTAARSGDQDAWEELYRAVYPRLRGYVARRVPGADVDDIMSEIMASAVAGIERFPSGSASFDGWLFGIARRVVFEHGRRPDTTTPRRRSAGSQRRERAAARSQFGMRLEIPEKHAWVCDRFERLAPGDQELLELRVAAGLTTRDVALVLGKRPGTVRTAQTARWGSSAS
jgi:RNA polymerase sigma-70 factor (ECF subfamily)